MEKDQRSKIKDQRSEQSEAGFTLIEVLVSAAILVILGFGFLGLQYILSKNQTAAWNNYFAIEETNRAISNFTKEVRNAASSDNGGYPLESLGDQEIIFYSDYDYDGSVERIRYTLSGTQFIKGIIEPSGNPVVYDTSSEKQAPISEIIRNGVDPVFSTTMAIGREILSVIRFPSLIEFRKQGLSG